MLETPHVVVAAAIAYKIGNPILAFPLAFASHFVFEKVPHWNPHLNTEKRNFGKLTPNSQLIVATDSLSALFLGTLITLKALPDVGHAVTILLSCFIAAIPDLIEAPYYLFNVRNKFIEKTWIPFKKSLQVDTSPIPGLLTQAVTIVAAFWWILT